MENAADLSESVSGRRVTPGPMPEAFLALLPVLACFLGGATAKWGEGIIAAFLGIFLIVRPPRYSLGIAINLALLSILICAATGFLPANWFYQPNWRATDFNDFGIVLPATVSPQPWITFTYICSLIAGLAWLYVMCSERLGLREVRTALRMFAAGVIALAAICILFWLRHSAMPFWHNERNFGPFPNRNQTGNLFGLAAILVLACGQDDFRKGRKRWLFWVAGLGVLIAALVINFSRAGLGILVVGSALWLAAFSLCQRRPVASSIALVVSFLLLLFTSLLLFGGETLERFHLHDLHNADISNELRWRIFSDVFQLIHDSPFVGIGLGNFNNIFAVFRASSFNDMRAIHPESDWLWLWSESGWIAVAAILVGLAFVLPKIFPMREGTNQRFRLATLIACVLFMLHGLVDVSAHRVGTVFSALFLLGVSIYRPHSFKPSRTVSIFFRVVGLFLLVIGSTWVVAARGHKLLPGSLGVTNAKYLASISNRERDFAETVRITSKALEWSPLDWELYFSRA
ncbi:MAG: hypothetical protein DME57_03395, partial [Verrucomicrobia bacterium]